jgi:tRNA threonylcarbamoyladenosine biosynthesis protein TsaE
MSCAAGPGVALPDADATHALGRQLAAALPEDSSGWMILLQGELGSGKSTLARALLRSLGVDGPVPSPTYTLVEPYEVGGRPVYHVDLYRIGAESELRYLGWSELRQGLMLIEWPERAVGATAAADIEVVLDFDGNGRKASVTALSERAAALLLPGGTDPSPVDS